MRSLKLRSIQLSAVKLAHLASLVRVREALIGISLISLTSLASAGLAVVASQIVESMHSEVGLIGLWCAAAGLVIFISQAAGVFGLAQFSLIQQRVSGSVRSRVFLAATKVQDLTPGTAQRVSSLVSEASGRSTYYSQRTVGDAAVGMINLTGKFIGLIGIIAVLVTKGGASAGPLLALIVAAASVATLAIAGKQAGRIAASVHAGTELRRQTSAWQDCLYKEVPAQALEMFQAVNWALSQRQVLVREQTTRVWAESDKALKQTWGAFLIVLIPLFICTLLIVRAVALQQMTIASAIAAVVAAGGGCALLSSGTDLLMISGGLHAFSAVLEIESISAHATRFDGKSLPSMSQLSVSGLGVAPAGRPIIDNAVFTLPPGTLTALVGPNGAGKSSLVSILAGAATAHDGTVLFGETPLLHAGRASQEWRNRVAYLGQETLKYPIELDCETNVLEVLNQLAGEEFVARVRDIGGQNDGLVDPGFSGGEWQKLNLARLCGRLPPDVALILLDEPTAQLDLESEGRVIELFRELALKAPILVVTHREQISAAADQVLLVEGETVRVISPTDFLGQCEAKDTCE